MEAYLPSLLLGEKPVWWGGGGGEKEEGREKEGRGVLFDFKKKVL